MINLLNIDNPMYCCVFGILNVFNLACMVNAVWKFLQLFLCINLYAFDFRLVVNFTPWATPILSLSRILSYVDQTSIFSLLQILLRESRFNFKLVVDLPTWARFIFQAHSRLCFVGQASI